MSEATGSHYIQEIRNDNVLIKPRETFTTEWTAMLDDGRWSGIHPANRALKENNMNISADYEGKIKRIGNQFLLKLGCMEFICQNTKAVGAKVAEVLAEEYKKRDTPEEE